MYGGLYVDYHVHPGFSIDADPYSIDDYCTKAIAIGLKELCFTPHLEADPKRRHLDWFVRVGGQICPMEDFRWLDCYFRDIEKARLTFGPHGLVVRAGLEAGYDRGLEKAIERVVTDYPFDFVLGSVHCLDHLAISSKSESKIYFPGKQLDNVVKEYFSVVEGAVDTNLFDCIGHLDLYRRYGYQYFGEKILTAHERFAVPLFKKLAIKGLGLEVNTSSVGRGLQDFHPTGKIIETALEAGIKIYTIGSDAHRLNELGREVDAAIGLLAGFNIQPVTFAGRKYVTMEKGGQKTSLTIK